MIGISNIQVWYMTFAVTSPFTGQLVQSIELLEKPDKQQYTTIVKLSMKLTYISGADRGSGHHLKNHKNIGFLSNTGPDPLKNHKAASIQCWAIIGLPAKRLLNGILLAG